MVVFRITRRRFIADALTGEGARRDGGRWNSRGRAMVYTASSRPLALLEVLVHVDSDTAPDDLVLLTVEIPDTVSREVLSIASLPKEWRHLPAPGSLADIGDQWLQELRSATLLVPSAILPSEQCVLINPLHADSATIQVVAEERLLLDPRLL